LTAAYGIEAAGPRKGSAAAGFRSTVIERQLDHVPAMSVHYDTNFAALVVRGCDHARHIGDLKSPVDRNPSSARTKK
jgi:hypothetical protein